jgi:hypothetical protein
MHTDHSRNFFTHRLSRFRGCDPAQTAIQYRSFPSSKLPAKVTRAWDKSLPRLELVEAAFAFYFNWQRYEAMFPRPALIRGAVRSIVVGRSAPRRKAGFVPGSHLVSMIRRPAANSRRLQLCAASIRDLRRQTEEWQVPGWPVTVRNHVSRCHQTPASLRCSV